MSRPGALADIQRVSDPAVRRAMQSIVEAIEFREGRRPRQDPLDRFVTARELRQQSARDIDTAVTRAGGAGGGTGSGDVDLTPPPIPTGFQASAGVGQAILVWDNPWSAYDNHGVTEVWRADVDDIGQAVLVNRVPGRLWVDSDLPEGATRYYWVRFVSTAGVEGAFSSSVSVTVKRSAEAVRDALTATEWTASTNYQSFAVVAPTTAQFIDGVEARFQTTLGGTSGATEPDWTTVTAFGGTVSDGTVTWEAIEVGRVPFITGTINGQPTVFMHGAAILDLTVRDQAVENLNATKLFATTGTIAEAIIGNLEVTNAMIDKILQSTTLDLANGVGWRIDKDGQIEAAAITIRDNSGNVILTSGRQFDSSVVDVLNATNASQFVSSGNKITASNIGNFMTSLAVQEAYLADASVGTIKIQGQAVTFPVSSYSSGTLTMDGFSGWETVASVTISSTGAPIDVNAVVQFDLRSSGVSNATALEIRLTENGGTVYGATVCGYVNGEDSARQRASASASISRTPGSGNRTYRLQMRRSNPTNNNWAYISGRYIRALETKR